MFESLRFHLLSFCCRSHAVSFVSPLTTVCERGGLFAVFRRSDAVVSFLRMRVAGPKASGQRVRTSENRAEAWAEGFRRRIAYFVELLLTLDGPNDSRMTPAAVLVTVIAYFLVLYLVASLSGRRADNQGFFVGNRRSPWPVVAFAMIGSSISGVTFVSVPGWVQASQFSYLQMALGFVAGQLVIAFVLIPLFYRMGLVSIYQYLESRFGISSYRPEPGFSFCRK